MRRLLRKTPALVVVWVAFLSVLPLVPAAAHSGAASAFYQTFGTLAGSSSVLADPDLSYNPTTGATDYDMSHTGSGSPCPGSDDGQRFYVTFWHLNSAGEQTGSFSGGVTTNRWQSFCTTYTSSNPLHSNTTATTGLGGLLMRVRKCDDWNNPTPSTCGAIVMEAATMAAPASGQLPPENLRIDATFPDNGSGAANRIKWDAPSDGEPDNGYRLFTSETGTGGWSQIASQSGKSFDHESLTEGELYCYGVRARGSAAEGLSGWSNFVCVEAGVAGSEGTPAGGGDLIGDGTDPDTEASCGLNPFCWLKAALKWAFWPGETTQNAWQSFYSEAEDTAPIAVVGAAITAIGNARDCASAGHVGGIPCSSGGSLVTTSPDFDPTESEARMNWVSTLDDIADDNATVVGIIRSMLAAGMIALTAFALWRKARANTGDQSAGAEPADEDESA